MRTAGLLHNLGLLWLADNRQKEAACALNLAAHESISINQALQQIVGAGYCEVGGYLGDVWGLPDILVVAMREHLNHGYNGTNWQCAALVRYAAVMVSAVYKGVEQHPENLCPKQLNIDPADRDAVFAKIAAKLEGTREIARTLFPG